MLGEANAITTIFASVFGVILTAAGLYYAYNHRRQVQLQIADHRFEAYAGLWSIMKVAAPMRTPEGGSLRSDERGRLFDQMTDWYFDGGHGMLLEPLTREMYLTAKQNLVCTDDSVQPPSLRKATGLSEQERGLMSIKQLDLLRNQMKTDIVVFGVPFFPVFEDEKAFLSHCGADLGRPPWSRPWYRPNRPESHREP